MSNITVRNALENLVIEGIVTRKRGKGTFVSEKKISSNITRLQSGTQLFQESGMTSHVELLEAVKVKANLPTATQFGLPEGALFNTLTRRRMLDAVPYSLETVISRRRSARISATGTRGARSMNSSKSSMAFS